MATIDETGKALDKEIRDLLDARDSLYQVDKMSAVFTPANKTKILADVNDRVLAARRNIAKIDFLGAGKADEDVSDPDEEDTKA